MLRVSTRPPAHAEPDVLLADALRFTTTQVVAQDWHEPYAFGRMHGGVILRQRTRELLHAVLSACARIAWLRTGVSPKLEAWLHDIAIHSPGLVAVDGGPRHYHFGEGDMDELSAGGRMPVAPQLAETAWCLRSCVALLSPPPDWSVGRALGYVVVAAHEADRPNPPNLPQFVLGMLGIPAYRHETSAMMLAAGRRLLAATHGHRFVILRLLEEQLMPFTARSWELRGLFAHVVRRLAREHPTPIRRAIVTAANSVLGASPKASSRDRQWRGWPV